MSSPNPQPSPGDRPRGQSKNVASIAWAAATIVVALVIGLIAWLAMRDDGDTAAPSDSPQASSAADSDGPEGQAAAGESSDDKMAAPEGSEDAAQSPPPEVEELLLSLPRRDADDVMAVGDVDAPVVLIEYADYRCPFCAQFTVQTRPGLDPLIEDGTLRIEFRDFVIFDEASRQAAISARAAAAQGHLDDYQETLFSRSLEGHAELERQDFLDIAGQVGVEDLAAFEEALDDAELAAAVDADTAEAKSLGISSTPTFLVNTTVIQGAQPADYVKDVISQEEAKAAARD